MRSFITALSSLALMISSTAFAAPFNSQGIITGSQLPAESIATAGGGPANAPPPPGISQNAIATFQLANFLENLESNYFQTGLKNLTQWDLSGYPSNSVETIAKVAAQEQVYVATISNLLAHFNATPLAPCTYQFPVTSAPEFFALANIITSVGIGAIANLTASIAATDAVLTAGTVTIITVEARHDAFRSTVGQVANTAPFDTRISGEWAFNLALPFVVPGSCPVLPNFNTLPRLILADPAPAFAPTQRLTSVDFAFAEPEGDMALKLRTGSANLFIGWVNENNVPVYTPAEVLDAGRIIRTAVPSGINGMAFAALTGQNTAESVGDLTTATIAGPVAVPVS